MLSEIPIEALHRVEGLAVEALHRVEGLASVAAVAVEGLDQVETRGGLLSSRWCHVGLDQVETLGGLPSRSRCHVEGLSGRRSAIFHPLELSRWPSLPIRPLILPSPDSWTKTTEALTSHSVAGSGCTNEPSGRSSENMRGSIHPGIIATW
jgi:hypothetical protein